MSVLFFIINHYVAVSNERTVCPLCSEHGLQEMFICDSSVHLVIKLSEDVVEVLVGVRDVTGLQRPLEIFHCQVPLVAHI